MSDDPRYARLRAAGLSHEEAEQLDALMKDRARSPAITGPAIYLGELPEDVAKGSLGIALLRAARGEAPKTGADQPDLRHLAADGAGLSDRRLDEVTGRPVLRVDGFTDSDRLNWLEHSMRSLPHAQARAFINGLADRACDIDNLRDAMDHFMGGERHMKAGA